jgi:molecular chaperone GrpE
VSNDQQAAPPETSDGNGGGAQKPADLAALTQALEEARAESKSHYDQWLRAQADMENLRKRNARDLESARKFAIERFAEAVLGVQDSLELGLSAAREAPDVPKLLEGMELTLKQLSQVFEKFNIRVIDPKGQAFNPEQHQAMLTEESTEFPPNTVVSVLTKGYALNDRLLRPAVVIVSKAPAT